MIFKKDIYCNSCVVSLQSLLFLPAETQGNSQKQFRIINLSEVKNRSHQPIGSHLCFERSNAVPAAILLVQVSHGFLLWAICKHQPDLKQ